MYSLALVDDGKVARWELVDGSGATPVLEADKFGDAIRAVDFLDVDTAVEVVDCETSNRLGDALAVAADLLFRSGQVADSTLVWIEHGAIPAAVPGSYATFAVRVDPAILTVKVLPGEIDGEPVAVAWSKQLHHRDWYGREPHPDRPLDGLSAERCRRCGELIEPWVAYAPRADADVLAAKERRPAIEALVEMVRESVTYPVEWVSGV